MKNCLENELYGKYIPQTRDVAGNESWSCLKVRDFEKETEGLITAAQDQALRTNVIKAKIEEENVIALCKRKFPGDCPTHSVWL